MKPSRPARPRTAGEPRRSPGTSRPAPRPQLGGTNTARARRGEGTRGGRSKPGSATKTGSAAKAGPAKKPPAPTLTLRSMGLFIVILVAFIVLAPTLRHAVEQQEQLRRVTADVAAAEERTAELEAQLLRWQDEDFVKAQARDRLGFVMPGERTYRVIDPHTVLGEAEPSEEGDDRVLPAVNDAPWYLQIWESVEVAGQSGIGDADPGDDDQA